MLSNFIENSTLKCHQYWPDESKSLPCQEKYGEFTVTLQAIEDKSTYIYRNISIKRGNQARSIEHYQFVAWPDHGVPATSWELVDFRNIVRKAINDSVDEVGPIITHCSAGELQLYAKTTKLTDLGVGRSGTYIALDRLMLAMEARDDLNLDIYAVVANTREARSTMVQTLIQYAFLFRTVEEILDKSLCNVLTENARRNSKTTSKPVSHL